MSIRNSNRSTGAATEAVPTNPGVLGKIGARCFHPRPRIAACSAFGKRGRKTTQCTTSNAAAAHDFVVQIAQPRPQTAVNSDLRASLEPLEPARSIRAASLCPLGIPGTPRIPALLKYLINHAAKQRISRLLRNPGPRQAPPSTFLPQAGGRWGAPATCQTGQKIFPPASLPEHKEGGKKRRPHRNSHVPGGEYVFRSL